MPRRPGVAQKVVFLLLVLLLGTVTTAGGRTFYKEFSTLTDVLSLIQNDYLLPVDNWTLARGAARGLQNYLGRDKVAVAETLETLTLTLSSDTTTSIRRRDITENALLLFEQLSSMLATSLDTFPHLTPEEATFAAIHGIVSTLDSHSSFIPAEIYRELRNENSSEFSGIGIVISLDNGEMTVVSPIPGTPADRKGIKAHDRILEIDNTSTQGMTLLEATSRIRGPAGTSVHLSVLHQGKSRPTHHTVSREVIPRNSVSSRRLQSGYGYIRITRFITETARDTFLALRELTQAGVKGLILDLRNNPGGLLDQAIRVSELFLEQGVIISTKGRISSKDVLYRAKPNVHYTMFTFPIIILVNEGSASGTEVLTAALQDNRRGLVIGSLTFGKGSIQTVFPLRGGSALRLSTSEFYTPNGVAIQKTGICPDLLVTHLSNHQEVVREKDLTNPLPALSGTTPACSGLPEVFIDTDSDQRYIDLALKILKQTKSADYQALIDSARQIAGRQVNGER